MHLVFARNDKDGLRTKMIFVLVGVRTRKCNYLWDGWYFNPTFMEVIF